MCDFLSQCVASKDPYLQFSGPHFYLSLMPLLYRKQISMFLSSRNLQSKKENKICTQVTTIKIMW